MTDAERIKLDTIRENALKHLIKVALDAGLFRSCINCEHWSEKGDTCTKFNIKPPARVIICGCEEHSDNLPF